MQLGFVSAILSDLTLPEVFDFAREAHFSCVELMCWPAGRADRKFAGVTHIEVASLTKGGADEIRGLALSKDADISGLGYYPNPLAPDPEVSRTAVEHLRKVISAAQLLGLKNVNTFIGRDWTKSVDDNWPRFLETWRPLIRFAEDCGVKIGIENCPMFFTADEWPGGKNLASSPAIWRRMFNDIPSDSFGLNYDPSHFALQGMDPYRPLHEFRDKLFHLHAKDVKINRDRLNEVGLFAPPLLWHQPRIPGYGEINWAQFMGTLMETGYSGAVCIEVEDDTFGRSLEGRQRALRVAGNVLRPYIC